MAITETIKFLADIGNAIGGFDKLQNKAQALSGRLSSIGGAAVGAGTAIAAPIAAGFGAVLKVSSDFESQMNQVKAVSGATGAEFEKLRNQAKELGSTTAFSAKQAAQAQGFLAMAGFNTNEVFQALPSTLDLAIAGQTGLAGAADIASNVLTGFQFEAKDLGRVNDVLAQTASSANTNISQLGTAFSYAGPIAKTAGIGFEETAALIGKLSDAGLQGEKAGTSLRGAISSLLKPSADAREALARLGVQTDAGNGQLRSMTGIIGDLGNAGATTADLITIFGREAGTGMAALLGQGSDAIADLENKLINSGGAASRMADIMSSGLQPELKGLASAFEGLALAIADTGILDLAARGVAAVTSAVRWISQLPQPVLLAGTAIVGLTGAIGGLLVVGGTLAIAVSSAITAFATLAPVVAGAGVAIGAISAPIALGVAALASIGVAAYQVITNWEALKDTTAAIFGAMKATITSWVTEARFRFVQVKQFVTSTFGGIVETVRSRVGEVVSQARNMGSQVIAAVQALPSQALAAGRSLVSNFAQGIIAAANAPIEAVQNMVTRIRGLLPSSPAKWGALSDIDTVGYGMMDTIASSLKQAAPLAINAASQAMEGIGSKIDQAIANLNAGQLTLFEDGSFKIGGVKAADLGLNTVKIDPSLFGGNVPYSGGLTRQQATSQIMEDLKGLKASLMPSGRTANVDFAHSSGGDTIIEYKPTISINSSADPQAIINALETRDEQFLDLIERVTGRRSRTSFT